MKTILTLLISLFSLIFTTARAQVIPSKDFSVTADLMSLADHLVVYGYKTKTAMPLVQALEIYCRLGVTEETTPRLKITENTGIKGDTIPKTSTVSFRLNDLIADATEYAAGNKDILSLLKTVGMPRGHRGGPIRHYDRVMPNSTDIYHITFNGGEMAIVHVSGDGDTDLAVSVYDNNNNFIGSDEYYCESCGGGVCFTPRWTGNYIVKIKNLGKVYNNYVIATN